MWDIDHNMFIVILVLPMSILLKRILHDSSLHLLYADSFNRGLGQIVLWLFDNRVGVIAPELHQHIPKFIE